MSSDYIISVEHLSKKYRLGEIGVDSLREAAERFWHRLRGRDPEDEMGIVGEGKEKAEGGNLRLETGVDGEADVTADGHRLTQMEKEDGGVASAGTCAEDVSVNQRSSAVNNSSPLGFISQPSKDLWALRDVSFEVKRGEVLGIIGRNGAGKSTLLKILSRITEPTSGRAVMRGRVGSLLEVGTGFHPELTGRENVFLNGAILGMRKKEIENKFDEIVAFAEVEKFIDTPVKRYSSGMYVRLAFAVAAHLDPEILIVDEVLAVGDAAFQKKCLGKMGEVAHQGRTVLFVSHNMGSITSLCPKTLMLNRGLLEVIDKTDVVIEHYLTSGAAHDGQRIWKEGLFHPGVLDFRINAVRVLNSYGRISSSLDIGLPFTIEIDYEVLRPLRSCQLAVHFSTVDGIVVFQSFDSDKKETFMHRNPGFYTSRCHVPGNLLNAIRYVVVVYADIKNERILAMCEDVLMVDIHKTDQVGPYAARYGVVRVIMDWDAAVCGSGTPAEKWSQDE